MAPHSPKKSGFPKAAIQQLLSAWWDEQVSNSLQKPKAPDECRKNGGTVFDIQPELSSVQAVPILIELKDILGFEPSKKVIRRGGYPNRDTFINEMLANCQTEFSEHFGGSQSPSTALAKHEENAHA